MTSTPQSQAEPDELRPPSAAAWLARQIATLYPGTFAMVMATGIISNALYMENWRGISDALFAVNAVAYPVLLVATLIRAVRFGSALWADLISPRLVFSFFTIVAGTDVFGIGVNLRGYAGLALALWLFALVLWFGLIYLELRRAHVSQHRAWRQRRARRLAHRHRRHRIAGHPRHADRAAAR